MSACGWCRGSLKAGEERSIPAAVRYPAAVAMAFAHGGLWAMEWLAKPFCARCRAIIIPATLAAVAFVLALVLFVARLWLRR